MKLLKFNVVLLLMVIAVQAKPTFKLNSYVDAVSIQVNGVDYPLDTFYINIPTRYPDFDTIRFKGEIGNSRSAIYCNFKPDSSYSIAMACCGHVDIFQTYKLQALSLSTWDAEKESDKIRALLRDRPFISIKTKHKTSQPLFAWQSDASCETLQDTISKKRWDMGVFQKCFFWNNISTIMIYSIHPDTNYHENAFVESLMQQQNVVALNWFSFRLFDDQHYLIIYNERKKTFKLKKYDSTSNP